MIISGFSPPARLAMVGRRHESCGGIVTGERPSCGAAFFLDLFIGGVEFSHAIVGDRLQFLGDATGDTRISGWFS
jgi:hypothetical protein